MTSKPRKTVAIVDDDSSALEAAESLLDAHGFRTIAFFSAEEFLHSDVRTHVDCLLLDIHLGGTSGLDLRRRLTASGSSLPVIFMTALDSESVRREAIAAGCVAYLNKPFAAQQLFDALAQALHAPN